VTDYHWIVLWLMLLVSLLAAAYRGSSPRPSPLPKDCVNQAALELEGETLLLCLERSIEPLSSALEKHSKRIPPCSYKGWIHKEETLRVDRQCRMTVEPFSGRLRMRLGLRLDVNRASLSDLQALPRIGAVLAKRIVDERNHRGSFQSIMELKEVKGIGRATLKKITPFVFAASGE
jgi:competence ComEA-like helix-hairpin-helix protein